MNKRIHIPSPTEVVDQYGDRLIAAFAWLTTLLVAAFFISVLHIAQAQAQSTPVCTGEDLAARMQEEAPDRYAQLRAAADKDLHGSGIFWRIDKPGLEPSWLLGTMHMADPRISEPAEDVRNAIQASRTVLVENTEAMDPAKAQAAMMRVVHLTMYTDGSKLTDRLDDEAETLLVEAATARGLPMPVVQSLRPWLIGAMMALPLCEDAAKKAGNPVLDARVVEIATKSEIPVEGLETIEEQFEAISGLPESFHLKSLVEVLKLGPVAEDLIETMKQLYLAGDIAMIQPIMREVAPASSQGEGFRKFQSRVVTDRNGNMVDRALPYLSQGGAFIAVGALHLPGELGLVEGFKQAGYTVTRIR